MKFFFVVFSINEEMLILSLNMLNNHLFFARVSGHNFSKLLGNETSQLRTLLLKYVYLFCFKTIIILYA